MAFRHPHQLNLKRTNQHHVDRPYVYDRRRRKVYKWDAYYSSMDPLDARKRDLWELVERLDAIRLAALRAKEGHASKDKARMANLTLKNLIDPASQDS